MTSSDYCVNAATVEGVGKSKGYETVRIWVITRRERGLENLELGW